MKTKLPLAVLCCITTFIAFGQTVPFPTDTIIDTSVPFSEKMDDVFGNLDLTNVTTNLLLDRAWPFAKPAAFDGSMGADTVKSHKHWLKLYGTMVTAATVQPSPIPSINDWKAQRDSEEAAGKNPLVIIHADYHRIKRDSALIYSLFYEQNGELYDYPNQSTSPYEAQTLFAFSPYKTTIKDSLSMDFKTSPAFFKTNTGLTVSTLEFDFDDGQGWKTTGLNTTTKVSWSTFGKKHLKLRITYTDNQVFYGYSTLTLIRTSAYQPAGAKNYDDDWDDIKPIEHPSLNNYGIDLQIEYACGNDKILKPFIYVEGFSPDAYFEGFENETYIDFFTNFSTYQDFDPNNYPLLDELEANGYDIIYVDFEQGTGNILENAQTLKKAIKWVNDQKAANGSTEPNVVAGYSMGGLVARLAIRQMELDNTFGPPDVSYFITVDTPHLGANIPYAVAIAVDDLYRNVDISDYEEGIQNAYNLLNSPAAKQMLIYAFDIGYLPPFITPIRLPAQMRSEFISELEIGLPQSTLENVAIAKGNGVGNSQGFTGVADLITMDIMSDYSCTDELVDTYDLIDGHTFANTIINLAIGAVIDMAAFFGATAGVGLDINALPGGNESFKIYKRYLQGELLWGLIDISLGQYEVKAHGIPFDSAPGGNFPINAVSGAGESAQFFQDILAGNYLPCIQIHETQFGFVPTVSALNIPGKFSTPFAQIDPAAVVANNETEFDRVFILDPTLYPPNTAPTNESHIDLTPSNVGPFEEFISVDYYLTDGISTLTSTTLNYGSNDSDPDDIIKTADRILGSLTLSGTSYPGGGLCINCSGYLEIIDDNSFPVNTATNFEVMLLPDCSNNPGLLQIETNGVLRIGENSGKTGSLLAMDDSKIIVNDGLIEVRPNSKLIINPGAELRLNGGILRVQDGGEVIIKDGGKLIYEAGTQIELNGNDAMLALGGLTRIGDNATFTFTYQGTESGYIRLLEEGFWGQRFSAGVDAEVMLQGEGQDDLILYLEKTTDFWEYKAAENVPNDPNPSQKFKYVQLKDGKVLMEENSRIVLQTTADIINTHIEATDYIHPPDGIVNFTFCEILNSNLYRIPIVAELHYNEEAPLFLTNSYFESCEITVRGYAMRLLSSHFNSSAVHATQSTLNNTVNNCLFENYSLLTDDALTTLIITQSEFYDNTYAVVKANGRVTSKCSRYERNDEGIRGENLAEINLSTVHNGGYNYFASNTYNIYLEMASVPLLRDGYNALYDASQFNIYGLIDAAAPPCPNIVATNNTWTPHSGSQPGDPNLPDFSEFSVYVPNTCQVGMVFGNTVPLTKCGSHDSGGGNDDPGKSNEEATILPLISTPTYFNDVPFDQALFQIASVTTLADSANGNDLLSADMYYELLMFAETDSIPSDSMMIVIDHLRWEALRNYQGTVERLFSDGVLLRANNSSSFEPLVQNYVSTLMEFTDSIKTQMNYRDQVKLELMKSALFSTLNKKNLALQIITNVNLCDHDSLQKLILEEQIQQLSFDLLSETQGINMYLQDSVTFALDSSIFQIPFESFIDSSGFGSYIQGANSIYYSSCNDVFQQKSLGDKHAGNAQFTVYPNPAQMEVHVQIIDQSRKSDSQYEFILLDFSGKIIFKNKLKSVNSYVSLPKLPSALYFYQIKSKENIVDQGKLSILQ